MTSLRPRSGSPALAFGLDYGETTARGTIPGPSAAWAGHLVAKLSVQLVWEDFALAVTQPAVARTRDVTIGTDVGGHYRVSNPKRAAALCTLDRDASMAPASRRALEIGFSQDVQTP